MGFILEYSNMALIREIIWLLGAPSFIRPEFLILSHTIWFLCFYQTSSHALNSYFKLTSDSPPFFFFTNFSLICLDNYYYYCPSIAFALFCTCRIPGRVTQIYCSSHMPCGCNLATEGTYLTYLTISKKMHVDLFVIIEVSESHADLFYSMQGQKCPYWDRLPWLMSVCSFARCVHACWSCASALDGISCHGSFFRVCRAVFPAAEMASYLTLSKWGTIGSSAAGIQVRH